MSPDTSQLIADPYLVRRVWGRLEKSHSLPPMSPTLLSQGILFLSPIEPPGFYFPYPPIYPALKNIPAQFFTKWDDLVKRMVKIKSLMIDPSICLGIWEEIRPRLQMEWKISRPRINLSQEEIETFIEIYSQAEMAMIYACSYLKAGVHVDEIRYQISDYLMTKTKLRGEVMSRVECRKHLSSKKSLEVLTPPSLIHFTIGLREYGIGATFFKTIGLSSPPTQPPESMIEVYRDTLSVFKKTVKKLSTLKLPDKLTGKGLTSGLRGYSLFFRSLAEHSDYLPMDEKTVLDISDNNIYMFFLRNNKWGIIMGVAVVIRKNQVQVLDKYGWDYLQFPW